MKTLGKLIIKSDQIIKNDEMLKIKGGYDEIFYGCDCYSNGNWVGYWNGWFENEAEAENDSEDHFEDVYSYPTVDCDCCENC